MNDFTDLLVAALALLGFWNATSFLIGIAARRLTEESAGGAEVPGGGNESDGKEDARRRGGSTGTWSSSPYQGCRGHRDRREAGLILEATFGLPRNVGTIAGQIVDLANRDFVQSWYKNTSPDTEFLEDTRLIMLDIIGGFVSRLCSLNFSAFLVKDVAPILRRNVVKFHDAHQKASKSRPDLFSTHRNETYDYVEREEYLIKNGLFIHDGAKDGGRHIQTVTGRVLQVLLPPQDRQCTALFHLIREIIVRSIVFPLLESLHPCCLNTALVNLGKGADGTSHNNDEGRAVNTFKAAAESFLSNTDESSLEDDPSVRSGSDHLTNDADDRANGGETVQDNVQNTGGKTRASDTMPILSLVSARIFRPELALDYSDSQDPTPYMAYILEIKASTQDDGILQWTEKTRYSKLKRLNEVLNRNFPSNVARFPGSRGWKKYLLGLPEYDKSFVDTRVMELNGYLDTIMNDPTIRESALLRRFLCGPGFKARLTQLEQGRSSSVDKSADELTNEVKAFQFAKLSSSDLGELYKLIEQVFLLDQGKFSFFRSNIISFVRIILKTAFKGSVFAYLSSLSENQAQTVADALLAVREGTWPNGHLAPPPTLPPDDEQKKMRIGSLDFLRSALPQQVVSLIGDEHRDLVASSTHELLQYHTLTKSISLEIADALIRKLFPEA